MTTTQKSLSDRFNAGLGIFDSTVVLWASEHAADEIGVDAAKVELKKINRIRERHGLPVAVHPFGHRLF